ncbi:MAG TPA: protease modulator HflC [Planctomycetaceae bacterium]|nr:protease modulator HflC [Planctomycetaceae bacterium]
MSSTAPPIAETYQATSSWTGWLRPLVGLCVLAALLTTVVFVDENEFVIVERLGVITAVYDQIAPTASDRGLHFKWPWPISTVRRFDRRELLFDPPAREMFTRDRKNVTVSSFLAWRIPSAASDAVPLESRPVVQFYRRLGSRENAEARLDARLRAALSAEVGQSDLNSLLHVDASDQGPGDERPLSAVAQRTLAALTAAAGQDSPVESLGLELIDLRIRRINLPEGNRIAVYERMRTERLRIAERYRSAGAAERLRIESQAQRQSDELLARADADAERIRGEGEAQAVTILNEAHALDPQLYELQRTLAAYSQILNRQSTVVLSAGSRLFRLLQDGLPPASRPGDPGADNSPAGPASPPSDVLREEPVE